MKITIITNEYSAEGGGLSYSCQQIHHLLDEMGHDVGILSSNVNEELVIHGGYNKNLGMDLAHEAKMKHDILIYGTSQLFIAFGGGFNAYYAALLAKKSNIPLWIMFRGSDGNLAKWNAEISYQTNFAVDVAERIICLSKELADNLKLITSKGHNIDVIPNYAVRIENNVKPFPKENDLHVGCGAAHMNEKKGVSKLIELVASYNNQYKEKIHLDIVGEIDPDVLVQYQYKTNACGVLSYVNFIGGKTRDEFRKIQKTWDLYIQTSVCEGMGNSVTDSMSMGIPVMISNTGFIAEFANKYYPQMVFSSATPDIMSNEIHAIINKESAHNEYTNLYDTFFEAVSVNRVRKLWSNLFSSIKACDIIPEPDSIVSVSLHDVDGDEHDNITTPTTVFQKFCEDVNHMGFALCSMRDYLALETKDRKRHIVCTFDDGYVGLLQNAMPIMQQYGFTATVFVCTDYIGQPNDWNYKDKKKRLHMSFEELTELQEHGWEIGSHGVTHRSLLRLNDEEIIYELSESKRILEEKFGPIISYAYPYGDYSNYIMELVNRYYTNAFLLTQGGVFLAVDSLRIHRYYISEIYKIIGHL